MRVCACVRVCVCAVQGVDCKEGEKEEDWLAALGIPILPFHTNTSDDIPVDP